MIGREDLFEEPKYRSDVGRMEDAAELTAIFEKWLCEQPTDEAVETFNKAGIPATHYRTVAETAELDHITEREVFEEILHSVLGEHNCEILLDLGYDFEDIEDSTRSETCVAAESEMPPGTLLPLDSLR